MNPSITPKPVAPTLTPQQMSANYTQMRGSAPNATPSSSWDSFDKVTSAQPKPTYLQSVGDNLKNTFQSGGQDVINDVQNTPKLASDAGGGAVANIAAAGATAGHVAGDVAKTAGNILGSFITPLLPDSVKSGLGNAQKFVEDKVNSIPGMTPEIAKSIGDLFNTETLKGGEVAEPAIAENAAKVIEPVSNTIKASVKNTVRTAVNKIVDTVKPSSLDDKVLNYIKPNLTPTEEAAAKSAGRGSTEGGILNRVTLKPTSEEVEMSRYAKEAGVDPKNTFDQNIQNMKTAQTTSAQNLREGLRSSKATWNQNEIKSTLDSVERPITIKSDPTLNRISSGFRDAIVSMAKGIEKKPEGILDLRQNVDNLISKEFPSNIYTKDTPIGQYVRSVRQSLNDLAESKLPDGQLPSGGTLKGELRRQSLLYKAIDNVAEKSPSVGESARPSLERIRQFAKDHPIVSGAVSALGADYLLKKAGVPVP